MREGVEGSVEARLRDIRFSARPNLFGVDQDEMTARRTLESIRVIDSALRLMGEGTPAAQKFHETLAELNHEFRNLVDADAARKLEALERMSAGLREETGDLLRAAVDDMSKARKEAEDLARSNYRNAQGLVGNAAIDVFRGRTSVGGAIRGIGDALVDEAIRAQAQADAGALKKVLGTPGGEYEGDGSKRKGVVFKKK